MRRFRAPMVRILTRKGQPYVDLTRQVVLHLVQLLDAKTEHTVSVKVVVGHARDMAVLQPGYNKKPALTAGFLRE